ncbi:MAG: IMP dehydrogenase [Spirochaetales bacterium]|nr:IMP dehydrogenase [Spirochaetales bacterium]
MKINDSLSYDDVLLVPDYADFLPSETDIKTRLVGDIYLNAPIVSAAMDTVTEKEMAIAIALQGGTGIIHRNLNPELQAEHVSKVKRFLNWVIEDPVTVHLDMTINQVNEIIQRYNYSGFPVIDSDGKLVGIITDRDMRFCTDGSLLVKDIMTTNPVTESINVTPEKAHAKFHKHKIEKLPVIDSKGKVCGLITVTDIEKHKNFPNAATDNHGRLLVGAAISPNDYNTRIPLLLDAHVDFVALDTAHGDSKSVLEAISTIKRKYEIPVIGGNVATAEGTRRLIEHGADAVKVGVGPGSICTTRIVAGIGVPQFTAVLDCTEEADKHNIPVIADGGVKFSGDITKAICAGASTVMLGNLLAGLKESPGKEIIFDGRMFKSYRGMGSIGAIKEGSGDRYQMSSTEEAVPEGIEGRVPYKGELKGFLHQLLTGLRKGMGYCGCPDIEALKKYRKYVKITPAGLKESHAHDISITQEAPNYSRHQ